LSRHSIYRSPTFIGSPRGPKVIAESCEAGDGIAVIDWVLTDNIEMVSDGGFSADGPKFCMYTADKPTWIETRNEGIQEIPANGVVLLSSDVPIHTRSVENTRHLTLVLPHLLVMNHIPAANRLCGRQLPSDCGMADVARNIMQALRHAIGIANATPVKAKLVGGLLSAMSGFNNETTGADSGRVAQRIRLIEDVIADRYADPDFDIEEIAREIGLSVRCLHAICQGRVSPGEMIRQYRLCKAEEMLGSPRDDTQSITDIALACGFNSSAYFSTCFKSHTGVTPRAYRSGCLPLGR
jgi:AraC-like DNA-binding protein